MTILHPLTRQAIAKVQTMPLATMAARDNANAVATAHPLLVSLDAMLRAAETHAARYGSKLCEDYFTGPHWLAATVNLRALLNCDFGPLDNGTGEAIFWHAMNAAGYGEEDI